MIEPELKDGKWHVPDAKEFIQNCRWENGHFIVPNEINGTVAWDSEALAKADACLTLQVIKSARELERDTA